MSATVGSGIWTKMMARLQHLLQAGGMSGEVRNVREDLAAAFKPMLAVTMEEYDYPAANGATTLLAATLSTNATSVVYKCNGAQGLKLSPPRNVEVVVASSGTPGHMAHSVVVAGLDVNGLPLSETITGTNGGAGTYSGAKCFALVLSLTTSADGGGIDATFTVYNGIVIGLSQTPMLRSGQTVGLCRREIVDGSLLSSNFGTLTAPATNPPYGAYAPHTAPTTQAAATTSGSVDVTSGAIYGTGGTLAGGGTGLVLELTVNGVEASVTFDGTSATGSDTYQDLLAYIAVHWPGLVATLNGSNHLVLTTSLQDESATIIVASNGTSTANTTLGLTAGTYSGTGHRYAMEYEYDAALQNSPNLVG
jgi:hypothetical protein